jgi:hypothetical protein
LQILSQNLCLQSGPHPSKAHLFGLLIAVDPKPVIALIRILLASSLDTVKFITLSRQS